MSNPLVEIAQEQNITHPSSDVTASHTRNWKCQFWIQRNRIFPPVISVASSEISLTGGFLVASSEDAKARRWGNSRTASTRAPTPRQNRPCRVGCPQTTVYVHTVICHLELVSQRSAARKEWAIDDKTRLLAVAGRWKILSINNAITQIMDRSPSGSADSEQARRSSRY